MHFMLSVVLFGLEDVNKEMGWAMTCELPFDFGEGIVFGGPRVRQHLIDISVNMAAILSSG